MTAPSILIVGRGRLGGSLWRALAAEGLRVRRCKGSQALVDATGWDVVLLCVPDAAIAEVARRVRAGRATLIAHCAGALDLAPLRRLAERGLAVGSLHPLQAVPTPKTRLWGWAAIDASTPQAARLLTRVARIAGMTPFVPGPVDRVLYHAAAAMAANGLVGLAAQASSILSSGGLSRAKAIPAILALMQSALDGVAQLGLSPGLTGPIARGDAQLVTAHLEALHRAAPEALALYRVLAESQLCLVTPDAARRAHRALKATGRAPAARRTRAPRGARAR